MTDNVLLVPRGRGMTAMFYTEHPEQAFELYVDITTPPVWDGDHVTAVDLDLDVIRRFDGSWYVDDEDEFAEHQVGYGYPEAGGRCGGGVRAGSRRDPFGGSGSRDRDCRPWKAAFRALQSR